jgi:hypothetical protein
MKTFSLITILIILSNFGYAQKFKVNSDTLNSDTLEDRKIVRFYILDSIYFPGYSRVLPTDPHLEGVNNYLQLYDGFAIISTQIRGRQFYHVGEIDGYVIDGNYEAFYTRGVNYSANQMYNFEIFPFENGKGIIHLYRKIGNFERYFHAHVATQEEVERLLLNEVLVDR